MIGAHRPICDNCLKVSVCKYREDYISIAKEIHKIIRQPIHKINIECKEYRGNVTER
jgi:hypothetical protein